MSHPFASFWADDVLILPATTGTLKCTNAGCDQRGDWCSHIETAVISGLDAPSVWDHGMNGDPHVPHVKVPVMPTRDLWAVVTLNRVGGSSTVLDAVMTQPRPDTGATATRLGFIGEGEGRWVLRQMIQDWFHAHLDVTKYRCKGIQHDTRRTRQVWQECRVNEVNLFSHCWKLYHYGKCLHCRDQRSANSGLPRFDPDLLKGM